ncbi:type II secretion system F family protein [Naasia sp. SYSU D00057]|uniref:type II secretion system F family protein n=1 Tax=Naasia sp. SYSU D00057 TaxID=2817380 RepID=UPI001B303002|nr:type II secretion system F family protein [Naasia sp. SYSU D00057]
MSVDPLEEVAETADRLAVLLGAGLTPSAAWGNLADADSAPIRAAAWAAQAGEPVAPALRGADAPPAARAAWDALAAGVAVAERTGAPLATVLEQLAGTMRDIGTAERDVRAALTGPRLSARLVMALPAVGIAFGFALGFDPIGVLFGSPVGAACAAAGGALFLAGWGWTRTLVRRARPIAGFPGLTAELVAVALTAGTPLPAARRLVEEVTGSSADAVGEVATLAGAAGVPVAGLLRGEARLRRRRAASEARIRAESLAVTLLLPLGLCMLPSFMLLSVAPLLLAIVSSTALPF